MKLIALILAATMVAPLAQAKGFKSNPSNGGCPPGLAKKNPPCVPPGLAKKGYLPGEFLPVGDYAWILNPFDFGLPELKPGEAYVLIGESYIKVNQGTAEIINLFDALWRVLDEAIPPPPDAPPAWF